MDIPIQLPDGWTAEADEILGVVITAVDDCGDKVFVTVDESKRSFELGMSTVKQRRHYSGRHWRKELYEEAVANLQAAMS